MSELLIKALCNPVRLKIIKCLSNKEKTVTQIIETCDLSQSAVSQHLSKLKKAGLVKDVKQGREVMYTVADKTLTEISNLILNLVERK